MYISSYWARILSGLPSAGLAEILELSIFYRYDGVQVAQVGQVMELGVVRFGKEVREDPHGVETGSLLFERLER